MDALRVIAAAALGLLLAAEAFAPAFVEQRRDRRRLVRHDLRNLLLGAGNALLSAFVFGAALVAVDSLAASHEFGLLRWLALPAWAAWPAALVLFDLWMYAWHRLNHAVPLLWRFHRMHHSDPAMDASSGVRFHPGEIALSGLARLIVVPLLGMSIPQLLVYEAVLLPVVLTHHANVRLPRSMDFGLFRFGLMVTPAMHRVHHSRERAETNSNYGSVLPIWDRLFGTLRVREDVERIDFGLPGFDRSGHQTLVGMLATPIAEAEPLAEAEEETAHEKTGGR